MASTRRHGPGPSARGAAARRVAAAVAPGPGHGDRRPADPTRRRTGRGGGRPAVRPPGRAPAVDPPLPRPGLARFRPRPAARLPPVRGRRAPHRADQRGQPPGQVPACHAGRRHPGVRGHGRRAERARRRRDAGRVRDVLPDPRPGVGHRRLDALGARGGGRTPRPGRRGRPQRRTHPDRPRVARRRDPPRDGDGRAVGGGPLPDRRARAAGRDAGRRQRHRPPRHHRPAAPARPPQPRPRHRRAQDTTRRPGAHAGRADPPGRAAGGVHRGGHPGGGDRQLRPRGVPRRAGGPDQRPQVRPRRQDVGPGAPRRTGDHGGSGHGRLRHGGRVARGQRAGAGRAAGAGRRAGRRVQRGPCAGRRLRRPGPDTRGRRERRGQRGKRGSTS